AGARGTRKGWEEIGGLTMKAFIISICALVLVAGEACAEPAVTKVDVYPTDINLLTARSRQSFIVQATYADGITRDVTDQAKATFTNPALARLDKNLVYPVADGATEMKVEFGGKSITLPVKVKDAKVDRPISFKLDVMPIFMKAGCN